MDHAWFRYEAWAVLTREEAEVRCLESMLERREPGCSAAWLLSCIFRWGEGQRNLRKRLWKPAPKWEMVEGDWQRGVQGQYAVQRRQLEVLRSHLEQMAREEEEDEARWHAWTVRAQLRLREGGGKGWSETPVAGFDDDDIAAMAEITGRDEEELAAEHHACEAEERAAELLGEMEAEQAGEQVRVTGGRAGG